MIHIAYGTDNLYAKFAATSMLSMFENTSENITVHMMHDDSFSQENRDKFIYIAGRYNQQINFYNVEKLCAAEIADFKNKFSPIALARFSIATTFRLLLPKVVSDAVEKIIYLDADTIINLDIKELWRVELGEKPLAAVPDVGNPKKELCFAGFVSTEDYFNSGILLINLNKWRQNAETITKWGVNFITSTLKLPAIDQDVLNYCFSTQYLKLPKKFNNLVFPARQAGNTTIGKNIYHYVANGKSLGLDINDNFHRLYWEYFAKTPFFNAETIGKLFGGFRKIYEERQNLLVQVSAVMSGKTRAFFTNVVNIDDFKKIFAVQEHEEIITSTSNEAVQQLINSMNESRGKKIFFIVILQNEIYQLKNLLRKSGFIEGRDFIDGKIFLSESHGVPLDCWEIIQNL